jgi:hypothetical protein
VAKPLKVCPLPPNEKLPEKTAKKVDGQNFMIRVPYIPVESIGLSKVQHVAAGNSK